MLLESHTILYIIIYIVFLPLDKLNCNSCDPYNENIKLSQHSEDTYFFISQLIGNKNNAAWDSCEKWIYFLRQITLINILKPAWADFSNLWFLFTNIPTQKNYSQEWQSTLIIINIFPHVENEVFIVKKQFHST